MFTLKTFCKPFLSQVNRTSLLMDRRTFLKTGAATVGGTALLGGVCSAAAIETTSRNGTIHTVTGPIDSGKLGRTLPHEHVMVDFVGVDDVGPERYKQSEVAKQVRPYLNDLSSAGVQTLFECTPAFLGRDPVLLRRLSRATGVRIVTNTGYYGARDDQHIPKYAYSDSVDALAARWINEWNDGIGDTDIRPGFIKIGVDPGPLSDIDEKLVRAACRAHLKTGLTIASHTGPAQPAFEQLSVLAEEGVDPSAWIWVHAQNAKNGTRHVEAAKRGAWVEFDGYEPGNNDQYLHRLTSMREHDLLHRVLLSHDNGWYSVGEPEGGDFQPYTPLFTELIPALREEGFTDGEIRQLVVANPASAFAIGVRKE